MRKRVIKKISLSAFVFATGLFLWANTGNVPTSVQSGETAELNQKELPCAPGYPEWPECL